MYKLVVLAVFAACFVVGISAQVNCANLATGYYCNADGSYTLCVNGYTYLFACATGTACACGTGNECDNPCTTACETGSSDAQDFCTARLGNFNGDEGYFCGPSGSGGFYQCMTDAFCDTQASPQSSFVSCPTGTECRCGDTFEECSSSLSLTPCDYTAEYQAYTTGTTTGAPVDQDNYGCSGHGFNCQDYSTLTSCNNGCGGDYCFTNIDTGAAECVVAGGCTSCNTASDCGDPSAWVCSPNTCCGSNTCAMKCG